MPEAGASWDKCTSILPATSADETIHVVTTGSDDRYI